MRVSERTTNLFCPKLAEGYASNNLALLDKCPAATISPVYSLAITLLSHRFESLKGKRILLVANRLDRPLDEFRKFLTKEHGSIAEIRRPNTLSPIALASKSSGAWIITYSVEPRPTCRSMDAVISLGLLNQIYRMERLDKMIDKKKVTFEDFSAAIQNYTLFQQQKPSLFKTKNTTDPILKVLQQIRRLLVPGGLYLSVLESTQKFLPELFAEVEIIKDEQDEILAAVAVNRM